MLSGCAAENQRILRYIWITPKLYNASAQCSIQGTFWWHCGQNSTQQTRGWKWGRENAFDRNAAMIDKPCWDAGTLGRCWFFLALFAFRIPRARCVSRQLLKLWSCHSYPDDDCINVSFSLAAYQISFQWWCYSYCMLILPKGEKKPLHFTKIRGNLTKVWFFSAHLGPKLKICHWISMQPLNVTWHLLKYRPQVNNFSLTSFPVFHQFLEESFPC